MHPFDSNSCSGCKVTEGENLTGHVFVRFFPSAPFQSSSSSSLRSATVRLSQRKHHTKHYSNSTLSIFNVLHSFPRPLHPVKQTVRSRFSIKNRRRMQQRLFRSPSPTVVCVRGQMVQSKPFLQQSNPKGQNAQPEPFVRLIFDIPLVLTTVLTCIGVLSVLVIIVLSE
jgi:hypothetical protein